MLKKVIQAMLFQPGAFYLVLRSVSVVFYGLPSGYCFFFT